VFIREANSASGSCCRSIDHHPEENWVESLELAASGNGKEIRSDLK
jgi:hypothetical protein